jgi:hypothetical protein
MTSREKVQKLVYVYDLSKMKIDARLPEMVRDVELDDVTLNVNMPSHEDRAASIAWDACYLQYLDSTPNGTLEDFDANLNMASYEQVTREIQSKIPQTVDLKELREIHRVQFLNLTRVDPNRQVDPE